MRAQQSSFVPAAMAVSGEHRDSGSSKETGLSADLPSVTVPSTILETDFTVDGRKGSLDCPFAASMQANERVAAPKPEEPSISGATAAVEVPGSTAEKHDKARPKALRGPTLHQSSDPICAAMLGPADSAIRPNSSGLAAAAVCPIRFLDQHSPEEVAHYVATHKHEIPRSHEVCVRRYQRNEDEIRKLDAKYGSLVNMIQDLSQLHRPMLPPSSTRGVQNGEVDGEDGGEREDGVNGGTASQRVEKWAKTVVASSAEPDRSEGGGREGETDAQDRQSRFDRQLRDVRVGESPSRPWGISVPVAYDRLPSFERNEGPVEPPDSPPAAPFQMPSPLPQGSQPAEPPPTVRKCPFDHTKVGFAPPPPKPAAHAPGTAREGRRASVKHSMTAQTALHSAQPRPPAAAPASAREGQTPSPLQKHGSSAPAPEPAHSTFVNLSVEPPKEAGGAPPQIVFNISGPVFVGYPLEQAVQLMRQFQGQ